MVTACPCSLKGKWNVRIRQDHVLKGDVPCTGPADALLVAASFSKVVEDEKKKGNKEVL
jgi:hypothetical protein